jgi:hypothetical protein
MNLSEALRLELSLLKAGPSSEYPLIRFAERRRPWLLDITSAICNLPLRASSVVLYRLLATYPTVARRCRYVSFDGTDRPVLVAEDLETLLEIILLLPGKPSEVPFRKSAAEVVERILSPMGPCSLLQKLLEYPEIKAHLEHPYRGRRFCDIVASRAPPGDLPRLHDVVRVAYCLFILKLSEDSMAWQCRSSRVKDDTFGLCLIVYEDLEPLAELCAYESVLVYQMCCPTFDWKSLCIGSPQPGKWNLCRNQKCPWARLRLCHEQMMEMRKQGAFYSSTTAPTGGEGREIRSTPSTVAHATRSIFNLFLPCFRL